MDKKPGYFVVLRSETFIVLINSPHISSLALLVCGIFDHAPERQALEPIV